MTRMGNFRSQGGFSLLEVTIALGISGTLMASIWQLTSVAAQQRGVADITSQAVAVTAASQNYVNSKRATLMAIPALATLGSAIRVKITNTDTGDTADSVQSAGHIAPGFVNINSYGQTYSLYVRREDAGSPGVADSGDRLIALLITAGGTTISDTVGAKIAGAIGAAGGFIYATDNPASPTLAVKASGSAGGWSINFSDTGWSGITDRLPGHLAILINLLPTAGGAGGGTGVSSIDGLTDGKTNYSSLYNVFIGSNAGENTTSLNNTGMGYNAMRNFQPLSVTQTNNTAFGFEALRYWTSSATGTDNTAAGAYAAWGARIGSRNVSIGPYTAYSDATGNNRTLVGYQAGQRPGGDDFTVIGYYAGASTSQSNTITGTTIVGAESGHYAVGPYNTLIGYGIGNYSPHTGSYNSALGFENIWAANSAAVHNTTAGYRAGRNISSGTNNILIGYAADAPLATSTYFLNIGNLIYGNTSLGQINLGSSTLRTGISFDVGSKTDSVRLPVGTTAQRPTCDSAHVAVQRWNTTDSAYEVCNGSLWIRPKIDSIVTTPAAPPLLDGYFVMTQGTWDGNLGGLSAANTKCYNDLVANDWMGKATAISNGQLTASNVKAFLCQQGNGACNNATPVSRYWFARSGDPAAGGASFVTDSNGNGPNNSTSWSGATYFSTTAGYWTNHSSSSATAWGNGDAAWAWAGGDSCGYWYSNDPGKFAIFGDPSQTNQYRWAAYGYGNGRACNQLLRLVCFVHP